MNDATGDAAKVFEKYDLDKDGFITLEETLQNLDLIQRKYKLLQGISFRSVTF